MSSGSGSSLPANDQSFSKASHRRGPVVLGERQIEAYLVAREALRRVKAAAASIPLGSCQRPAGRIASGGG